jgi:lipid II:glycine glycyltransferase (peptidoglycan interpeptide bridge formation enzyme)
VAIRQLSSPADLKEYDRWAKAHSQGTLWQSLEWKTYQEALGREVRIYADGDPITTSALVVIDKTTFGWSTWDIPRGPIGMKNEELRMKNFEDEIIRHASLEKCISLFCSPSQVILHSSFFIHNSPRSEQPPATRIIDLTQSEEAILAQMKQKGRYNIRLAEKHGVKVEQSTDIDAFTRLAAETALRDGFTAPPASRYQKFLESLPDAFLLLAYGPNRNPIAGLLGTIWPAHRSSQSVGGNGTGIYYYGASDYAHRALMAPYLLQWEAMKLSKTKGCTSYDLLGIAAPTNCKLQIAEHTKGRPSAICNVQSSFSTWSGITRFKEQFGGTVVEYPPEQQILLKPWVNKALEWKRKILG